MKMGYSILSSLTQLLFDNDISTFYQLILIFKMSDFGYDTYDVSTLKVAFQNLRTAEQQGFWLGVLGGFPLGVYLVSRSSIQHKFAAGPISRTASAMLFGSLIYGAYIFRARQAYNDVAAKINRKYSILLNKAITYN